jgi:hypothetical protein
MECRKSSGFSPRRESANIVRSSSDETEDQLRLVNASFASTSSFIIETPSPPGSVALFPQGFAFYVSHHHSLHSYFSLRNARSIAWLSGELLCRDVDIGSKPSSKLVNQDMIHKLEFVGNVTTNH